MITRNLILLICISMILGCSHNTPSNPNGDMYISADVYNNYLYAYVAESSEVQYATINPDGSINQWHIAKFLQGASQVASLNNYFCPVNSPCLLDNSTMGVNYINNDYLYFIPWVAVTNFGTHSPPPYWYPDILIYTPLHNDSSIGSWFTTTPFKGEYVTESDGSLHTESGKFGFTYIIYNNYLYMVGGQYFFYDGSPFVVSVVTTTAYASINPDGSINQWQFTTGLYSYGPPIMFVYNNWLYAIPTDTNTTYYRAPINPDGSLGARITYTTSIALSGWWGTYYKGYVYLVGGDKPAWQSTSPTTMVQYAQINADGSIGNWIQTTPLNKARDEDGVIAYNGYLYAIAGDGSGNSVEYAPINSDGSLGKWKFTTPLQ